MTGDDYKRPRRGFGDAQHLDRSQKGELSSVSRAFGARQPTGVDDNVKSWTVHPTKVSLPPKWLQVLSTRLVLSVELRYAWLEGSQTSTAEYSFGLCMLGGGARLHVNLRSSVTKSN